MAAEVTRRTRTATRTRLRVGLTVALSLVLAAVWAGPAAAKIVHPFTGTSIGPGGVAGSETFAEPQSVAVNQTTGDIYVYDAAQFGGGIYKFDSAGAPDDFSALGSNRLTGIGGGSENGHREVAVAPAGAPANTEGDLYVANGGEVKVFAPSGVELGVITILACGVTTDSAGHVFIADEQRVHELVPTTNPPTSSDETGASAASSRRVCGLAADGLGNIYAADPAGQQGVNRFKGVADASPTVVDPDAATIAVDRSGGDLYADRGAEVIQYDSDGDRVGDFGGGVLSPSSYGVAVNETSGRLYATDSATERVNIFGPPESDPLPPTVSSPSATEVTETTATLGATVIPGGVPATYHVEYLPDAQFRSEGGFSSPATVRTSETPIGSDEQPRQASATATGLQPGTTYDFRIVATNSSPGNPVVASTARTFLTRSPALSEAAGGCPNETLRAEDGSLGLPDCRAYERVTPEQKNGVEFNQDVKIFVGDGPRVGAEVFGAFGATESSDFTNSSYEFVTSSNSGWQAVPLAPPGSRFQGQDLSSPLYQLGDSGRSLFGLREYGLPGDADTFYVRQGTSITEVGPLAPPESWHFPVEQEVPNNNTGSYSPQEQFVTPDLSHVVYLLTSPGEHDYLWPFDQTAEGGAPSAYEYVGTGNAQPFLVGVRGAQGSGELVSGCGTSIGSFFGEDIYNAMSADGRTVYFTPWAGFCTTSVPSPAQTELYARVNGELPDAHTVAISEPGPADCSECDIEPGDRREAAFQGASEDGSKVFFVTEQELLPGNPGRNIYEYDLDGPPQHKVTAISHLASGEPAEVGPGIFGNGVVRVSEDGSHVYFVASAVLTTAPNSIGSSAVDGEPNLYVYDTDSGRAAFVASLAPLNGEGRSPDSQLWGENDGDRPAEATPDGRYLLFASSAQLTPDDTSPASQLFRYDAETGQLTRVSVGQNGYNDDGNIVSAPVTIPETFVRFSSYQNGPSQRMMSDDGSEIFFESTAALAPGALDQVRLPGPGGKLAENIYEWHNGRISLITDGQDRTHIGVQNASEQRSSVRFLGTTSTGGDAFFTTASQLVPADGDSAQDIYDAAVDGGIAEARKPVCGGEGCQSASNVPSVVAAPGSSALEGPGDQRRVAHHKHRHRHHKKHRQRRHQRGARGHRAKKGSNR